MTSSHSDVGARKHVLGIIPDAVNRAENDFYRTPPIATTRFLAVERFFGRTWEPACGDGAISEVLKAAGHDVVSSDLIDRGYGTRADFLTAPLPANALNIVTNPPYTHAEEFARRGLELLSPGGKLALLCRLLWLESKGRRSFFETSGLTNVWVFAGRINVARNGVDFGDGGEGGMVAFAWYVWRVGYTGRPTLGWI